MRITRRQLRMLIREEIQRGFNESRYTGGVRVGDAVWLKDDPDRGEGRVRGKYKHPEIGHVISVQWESGGSSLHIPSAITTSQSVASTWEKGRLKHTDISGLGTRIGRARSPAGATSTLPTDDDYPKILGYGHPETGEAVMITVNSRDDMDDILDPLLDAYPDLEFSID
jgi:hypothetical protein